MSASTWAWMVTSSAVVGSSAISSAGAQATPMAIITRWRMPPRELVGVVARRGVRRRGDADARQDLHRPLPQRAAALAQVQGHRLDS